MKLPATKPHLFKPQLITLDAELDQDGRVNDCQIRQRSKYEVLNSASCEQVRQHYIAVKPLATKKQKIAVNWTSRTTNSDLRACNDTNGTVPVSSSLWVTGADFSGVKMQNGAALLALDVGTAGRADRCTVLAATVSTDLQRRLCTVVVQRAIVMPAVDEHGKPVIARMKMTVGFAAP